jgi:hypothetical protein
MQMMGGAQNFKAMAGQITQLKQMLQGGNGNAVVQMFAQKNPQFAQFVRDNQGKSPEQIAQNYGLDWNEVKDLLK